ncbi:MULTISPECIES: DUF3291 domain-containing protein [unclassified Rhizobium]|uniref:DUF3291 domain-containing protein n=1 Tax=unclassified Rhizobium TaxID=2613769 RepID=UPI000EAA6AD2|nr:MULTISPECIES: DUF3291 domain-containing protein [unclassified Rhizobium]AYG67518.1 DUF3291 domain-containing protein [Rhizobium sp. CCGE531]AYG73912.1 DUF3291 domain-containing protein [Rhizobium sp. CCGE532]
MPASAGKHLAMYNFGLHVAAYESPDVEGFRLREAANFEAAARASGFIGRSGYPGEPQPSCWGEQVFPRFIEGSGFTTAPSSLSLWTDIESLMAFTYSGVHADALKHARQWNVRQSWPPLVLWWVDAGTVPVWKDGVERLEHLHDRGASRTAFSFKQPYGPDGQPLEIDRLRIKELVALNAATQGELLAHVMTLKV